MRRVVRTAVLLAVLLSASVACDSAEPEVAAPESGPSPVTTPTSPVELAVPPLRLPTGAPGDECPVTAPRNWEGPGDTNLVLGPGPVYPIAYYFHKGTVLRLRPNDRQPDGTYLKKVRWLAAGYTGPVLVRTARIDAAGTAAARFSYLGEPRHGGHYAVLTNPDTDLPGTTMVGGPGCYAYQVDGTTFSLTVVFRAEPEMTW